MPYQVKKTKGCFQVLNTETGKIHAKCTTKKKAEAQKRILDALMGEVVGQGIMGQGILTDVLSVLLGSGIKQHQIDHQMETHGAGFLDWWFKSLGNMFKVGAQPIKTIGRPIVKAAAPQIATALSASTGLPITTDLVNKTADLTTGEGIMDVIASVGEKLGIKKRQAGLLPPKSRKLLAEIGNEEITKMVLVRTPIESYINKTLSLVSAGQWQTAVQSAGYDSLFHLSVFINDKYVLHKIESTTLARENPIKSNSQTMNVPLNKTITILELINNTKKFMGDYNFTTYDPVDLNCQNFIDSVLTANGLNNPQLKQFVVQDAQKIFENTPSWTRKFARFVTDLGAIKSRLVEGEGNKKQKPSKWVQALKIYQKESGIYCIPKKGSQDYDKVKKIMEKL